MTSDLPLYPWPFPLLPALRQAKQGLDLPTVRPRAARYGDSRVLATEVPPFITEYALVRGATALPLADALRWVLGGDDSRAQGAVEQLTAWFGAPVGEVVE